MTKKIITYLFIAATLITFACKNAPKEIVHEEHHEHAEDIVEMNVDQYKMAGIELNLVEHKTLSNTRKVNGIITVSPQNLASVCASLGGFVKSTSLVEGSPVKKGQTLAIIENPEFIELQRSYLESHNRLEFAESEYKRHQELYKEDVYSKKNVQQVTADYKSLKAEVNALSQKLAIIGIDGSALNENNISGTLPVVAPIDGFVRTVNVNIGKYVNATDVLFEIINTSKLTMELTLFEKDIDNIQIGQKLWFSLPTDETKTYAAIISQVGKAIATDRTVKVYATVNQSSTKLLPGMYVNARIETSSNPVTAVPSEAVVRFDEKDYIFVFDKTKKEDDKDVTEFKMIEVKRGVTDGGYTEVILPVDFDLKNTKVVTKGAYQLLAAKKNAGGMAC